MTQSLIIINKAQDIMNMNNHTTTTYNNNTASSSNYIVISNDVISEFLLFARYHMYKGFFLLQVSAS